MNKKLIIKILVDICLTISLLLLMPYSLIGETAHEWIGMAMLVFFIIHHILNRKWICTVTKGKYTPFRIFQTVLVVVMLILMTGSMISGILLSSHIFKAVRIAGTTMIARQIHMFCAYWGLVVMSLHLGLHWNMVVIMTGKLFKSNRVYRVWFARWAALMVGIYRIYAFNKRQIGAYLLMKVHFVFYDYTENVLFFILDYVAVMALIAMISYYFCKLIKKKNYRK